MYTKQRGSAVGLSFTGWPPRRAPSGASSPGVLHAQGTARRQVNGDLMSTCMLSHRLTLFLYRVGVSGTGGADDLVSLILLCKGKNVPCMDFCANNMPSRINHIACSAQSSSASQATSDGPLAFRLGMIPGCLRQPQLARAEEAIYYLISLCVGTGHGFELLCDQYAIPHAVSL